jgi:hypothetical protein
MTQTRGWIRLLWAVFVIGLVLVPLGFALESKSGKGKRWWEFWKDSEQGTNQGAREDPDEVEAEEEIPYYEPDWDWTTQPKY